MTLYTGWLKIIPTQKEKNSPTPSNDFCEIPQFSYGIRGFLRWNNFVPPYIGDIKMNLPAIESHMYAEFRTV
jgi:hypothetical protein